MNNEFYRKNIALSLQELKSDPGSGLTADEAKRRLEQNGRNRLQSAKRKSMCIRILEQFKDFLVIILIIAAIISALAGDGLKDSLIIGAILIINMIIGITQENKAYNALKELKDMSSPKAKVKRGGQIEKIDSESVVAGDIIILEAGDYVPADIRLIESANLKIDEAALTGESAPVMKDAGAVLENEAGLGDRINTAYMGTVVTYGRGAGVIYAAGMDTEMGRIAAVLNETDETVTPLQNKLDAMAKMLGIICVAACAFIFLIGFLYGMDILEMMMVSVSLAVAAVPEGVAIVATVILAIGVQKMVRANVIVKKLRAVETLGSTTVICSDKTGTLTRNKMTVVKVCDAESVYDAAEISEITKITGNAGKNISLMADTAVLCNDAVYDRRNAKTIGDPTESAMLVFGAKLDIYKEELNERHKRVNEIPFDSDRKLMSVFNLKDGKIIMNTKGAADAIIKRSSRVYSGGEIIPMTDLIRQRLTAQNETLAASALRVLGFAYKEYEAPLIADEDNMAGMEEDLIYAGMMGMIDPPREEVKASVEQCRAAGINIKMITGDHKITAAAIAGTLGIIGDGDAEVLDGGDINALTDEQLKEKVKSVNVYARVSPEHKVRIVTAVKEGGNIVAMTGDGVNDAPSLKKADIGIAMGITGTDVSKEAADMILTDDNFVSIVGAIEQGRTIYGNIRKVTGYLLSCNIGEILVILLAIVFGLPVPLVATQLLFVNLLTDALPAFALGMEGKEGSVMKKQPRDPKEPIINKSMRGLVSCRAVFLCAGSLGAFLYGLNLHDYATAVTMCFFTLVAGEMLMSYAARSDSLTLFKRGLFANKFLNISMGLSFMILIAVIYIPFLNEMFTTVQLSVSQFFAASAFALLPLFGSELSKKFAFAQK